MRKLLIADDEPGVRHLVRMTLETDDYDIVEAGDGEEALTMARDHRPDVVLLDVMMPRMNGFEVCKALKDDPHTKDIAVVILTAQAQEQDRKDGAGAGADDYFTKPFSPIALLGKVDEIFESRGL
jgi:CheY-like chemotaxis protein